MNKEARPFEEYKEMIQDMNKDNMIRGLYDMSKHIIELENKINKALDFINTWINYKNKKMPLEVSLLDLIYIKEILKGDD